ncbi:MAG: response regulator [Nostoc sp. ChiSLP02]|nr:response regulator [Nostoc sp. DedSLP05]MDZ8103126.1 response regulator [Nostoc sp. DedSLP01]MDZ8189467.1 response regulator [Nostoc sp. ChiSLP02]
MPNKSLSLNEVRLLVVDDDPDTRKMLAVLFKLEGAKAIVVASAAEALEVMSYFQPEVLICDICLPGEDGYSLLEKVRRLNKQKMQPEILAIAMTAFVYEEERTRAFLAGFQAHLYKPIDLKELISSVTDLIEPSRHCTEN